VAAGRVPSFTLLIDGPVRLANGIAETTSGRPTLTLPPQVELVFGSSGLLELGNCDLVVHSGIAAAERTVFRSGGGAGRVLFGPGCVRRDVRAAWWGAGTRAGGAENHRALTAAIESIVPVAPGRRGSISGTVRLPGGTLLFDRGIQVPSGILLRGEGRSPTTLTLTNPGSPSAPEALVRLLGSSGTSRIQNLSLSGPGALPSGYGVASRGILVPPGVGLEMSDAALSNFDEGIYCFSARGITMTRCEFAGNGAAAVLDDVTAARFIDCRLSVSGTGRPCVRLGTAGERDRSRCVQVHFQGCVFEGNGSGRGQCGLLVEAGRLIQVCDCRFSGLENGIRFAGDAVDDIGAEVRMCRFALCASDVDTGEASARVHVTGRGGSADPAFMRTNPPEEPCWQRGDRILNATPAPGEAFGWVCGGRDPDGTAVWWSFGTFEGLASKAGT
jgi:hypothetical protein